MSCLFKKYDNVKTDDLLKMIVTPTDERLYQIMELLRRDEAINKLYELTKIDQFSWKSLKILF